MNVYKNNLQNLDELKEVLELGLKMILENIESSREEKLKVTLKDENAISIGEFSELLRVKGVPFGRNKVHSWLVNRGYCIRKNNKNYSIQKYVDEGLFKVKTYIVNTVDGPIETETIYLTNYGVEYFSKKLLSEFNIKGN